MKLKIAVIISLCITLLSGCTTNSKETVSSPAEVTNGEISISYNDTEEANSFSTFKSIVETNHEGVIRKINISNSDIITYKNISVGDSIDKITDSFEYESVMNDKIYSVLFDGNTEINPTIENKVDSWLWINYTYDDNNTIRNIYIYDVQYGREMR